MSTVKQKILLIAPRHYVNEIKDHYTNDNYLIEFYTEEKLAKTGVDTFIQKVNGKYDGFIGLADYSSLLASWLNQKNNSPAPKPEILASLQDKYLSRQIQANHGLYDKTYGHTQNTHHLNETHFPLFTKPRRASMSWMAGVVNSIDELKEHASQNNKSTLRKINKRWTEAYKVLELDNKNDIIVDDFVYESLIPHGLQVTLDGYVQNGYVEFIGFTKSVFLPNHISFKRFDFPFHFSKKMDRLIKEHTKKLITSSEFNNSLFNVEYKVDQELGSFGLIEINTRPSSQFMYPIQVVTDVNPLDLALDIVSGKEINHKPQETKHKMCSVCVIRKDNDARVLKVPTNREMEWLYEQYGSKRWNSFVEKGELLSDHPNDSRTFRFAEVIVPHKDSTHVHDYEDYVWEKMNSLYKFKKIL